MDRSVDSIGSCSLDVDADSTDFSDTSGSLNLLTPSSGKDFPREFTSRILDRCQPSQSILLGKQIHCQPTTTILDPNSGKISTILTFSSDTTGAGTATTQTPTIECAKKPSYLNLACCVNGYSNLTTYDSKLRRDINKSREVSPIRPITTTVYTGSGHSTIGNYLSVPFAPGSTINYHNTFGNNMMDSKSLMSPEKRLFTAQMLQDNNGDVTDNISATKYTKTTKLLNITPSTLSANKEHSITNEDTESNSPKSFIQQRVERLYGPGALAQGFYSTQRTKIRETITNNKTSTTETTNECKKSLFCIEKTLQHLDCLSFHNSRHDKLEKNNNIQYNYNNIINNNNKTSNSNINNNLNNNYNNNNNEIIVDEVIEDSLPVLRHLRPEFRAQLPIVSPKRSINKFSNDSLIIPVTDTLSNGCLIKEKIIKSNNINSEDIIKQQITQQEEEQLPLNFDMNKSTKLSEITQKNLINNKINISNNINNNNNNMVVLNGNSKNNINNNNNHNNIEIMGVNKLSKTSMIDDADVNIIKISSNDKKIHTNGVTITNVVATTSSIESPPVSKLKIYDENNYNDVHKNKIPSTKVTVMKSLNGGDGDLTQVLSEIDFIKEENNGLVIENQKNYTNINPALANTLINEGDDSDVELKNGTYFLVILDKERERLLKLAQATENDMNILMNSEEVSEDVIGNLRSAAGKARLLVTQKMRQFEGLCHNNLVQAPGEKFPTTCQDLQGFWDMVLLQVAHIDSLFAELDALKANNWKKPVEKIQAPPQGAKLIKRPLTTKKNNLANNLTNGAAAAANAKKSALAIEAAERREAQRKKLIEIKRKNKLLAQDLLQQQQQEQIQNQDVEFFIPENNS